VLNAATANQKQTQQAALPVSNTAAAAAAAAVACRDLASRYDALLAKLVPLADRAAAVGEAACIVWEKAVQDPASNSASMLTGMWGGCNHINGGWLKWAF
jgi:hypothetical protein